MAEDERAARLNTPEFWVGDEAKIREDHERQREMQKGKIGSNGLVNPYLFAAVEILLRHLDEARADTARRAAGDAGLLAPEDSHEDR